MKNTLRLITLVGVLSMVLVSLNGRTRNVDALIRQVKAKLDKVKDYQATARLKTDVSFINIPVSQVQVYFKQPDRFRIRKEGGISILPKGGVSVNLSSLLLDEQYTAVPAGEATVEGAAVKVIKLLPTRESSDIVLSTLYIDESRLLIRKAITTTRENGTYEMVMRYGRYAEWGLPDQVVFSFSTKDYKLPKGVTLEYDPGTKPANTAKAPASDKGRVEITYESYVINKGVAEAMFK